MKLILKKLHLLLFCAGFLSLAKAQDRQFTQFYASPLTLNPALTGAFDGKYRVGGIYRDQWRGLIEQPYQTYSVGADLRLEPVKSAFNKDKIGLGLLFFRDNVPSLDFSTTQIALSGAFHKALDINNTQYLSAGVQLGLTQRNVNYETLTFQDQWNGIDGYSLPRGERLPENNFSYPDLSLGVNYSATFNQRSSVFLGASYHHFNRPNVAFFKGDEYPQNRLLPRISAQLAAQFPINRAQSIMFSPRVLGSLQGPHLTVNAGANFRFMVDKTYGTSLHFGSWVRPVRGEDGFGIDALVFLAGIEYSSVLLGVTYDINLPTLQQFKRRQNVFEISIIYLGEYENDALLCPTF